MRVLLPLTLLTACSGGLEQPGEVPVEDAELTKFVEAGDYLDWASETDVHESAGPHFGGVRLYINDELDASLADGGDPHPIASAAIKELYGDGEDVLGWTVMVKVEDGAGGDTWYFWERFEGKKLIDGTGESACTGCHGPGIDHILTTYPLE